MFHRNSQKRFYGADKIYFIITAVDKRFPFFKENLFCELFIDNLRLCKGLKGFRLYAFNVIFDHIHLLLQTGEKYNISQVIFSIKKQFSHDVNRIIGKNKSYANINEGEQTFVRLHGDEIAVVNKYQNAVQKLHKEFIKKQGYTQINTPLFRWQKSFHDHVIRGENDFNYHYNYTVNNHAKHGLPDDWPYTSEHFMDMIDEY